MRNNGTIDPDMKSSKKIYNLVPFSVRKQLIDLVITKGLSVYKASKVINIKNTTAKAILRRYRKEGVIFCRKSDKIQKKEIENQEKLVKIEDNELEVKIEPNSDASQQERQETSSIHNHTSSLQETYHFPFYNYENPYFYYFFPAV